MNSVKEILSAFKAGQLSVDQLEGKLESWAESVFFEQATLTALPIVWDWDLSEEENSDRALRVADMLVARKSRHKLKQIIERHKRKKALEEIAKIDEEIFGGHE